MKLLIVDDQPGVTEGLCHGVNWAQLGFSQVQAVNSVREARAAMLNTVPDVMLCDIEMPEETGLELFKWVKKQGFATRCIFLTAHAKFSYAQEAMQWAVANGLIAGMDGRLVPQGSATRAQVATMLMRFAELLK